MVNGMEYFREAYERYIPIFRMEAEEEIEQFEAEFHGRQFIEPSNNKGIVDNAPVLLAVLAVTPFVQAVATHFGNRLAGAIDEMTCQAVLRFLRRRVSERSSPADETTEQQINDLQLRSERGWLVKIHVALPPEAIAQLPALHEAEAPDLFESPAPQLLWDGRQWLLVGVGPQRESLLQRWDAEAERWAAVG
ncbi:hypothetical protein [Streptomyces phaeochromogenes]